MSAKRERVSVVASAAPDYVFARFAFGVEVHTGGGKFARSEGLVVNMQTGEPGRDPSWVGQMSMVEVQCTLLATFAHFMTGAHLVNSLTAPARWAATSRKAVHDA
jgi:hypothetical protein